MPLQPAILGTARLNNFRLGYVPAELARQRAARVRVLIAGAYANTRVRKAGFTIHDAINDEPNTCRFTVDGTAPLAGQDLRVSINSDAPRLLFNGTIQTVEASYEGRPLQTAWACTATDDMARLNRKRPFGTYAAVSATTIALDLVTRFASGFTGTHVEAGLPAVSITFDGSDTLSGAFAKLAQLIGGYFYVEDLDVHLFLTEAGSTPDPIDGTPGRFSHTPPIAMQSEDSQLRTRVIGKGAGSSVSADVAAGMFALPVKDSAFAGPGTFIGNAILGSDIVSFLGRLLTEGKGTVTTGPTASPSAPTAAVSATKSGGALGAVAYYKTDVNDQGESEPSPVSNTVTPATVATPGAISSAKEQHAIGPNYDGTQKDWYTAYISLSRSGSSFTFTASGLFAGLVPGAVIRIFGSSTGGFDGTWTVAAIVSGTARVDGISTSAASGDSAYVAVITEGPLVGTFEYGVSLVSALGETAISAVTSVTVAAADGWSGTPSFAVSAGGALSAGAYAYWGTLRSANGETAPVQLAFSLTVAANDKVQITFGQNFGAAFDDLRITAFNLYRSRVGQATPFLVQSWSRAALSQLGHLHPAPGFNLVHIDGAADSALGALPSNGVVGAVIGLTGIPTSSDGRVTGRRLWRKLGGVWYPLALLGDRDLTTFYLDTTVDTELGRGSVGADPKPFGGAAVNVTVAVGASGTTSRKLYRTKAGPTAKAYFCGTLDANINTAYEDTKTDEDLGEAMPPYSQRRTLAGSTTLRVRDLATMDHGWLAGWARSGSQVFYFTSRSASSGEGSLLGIPATGPGSLLADTSTDAEIVLEPQLYLDGPTLTRALVKGEAVRLYVARSDPAAQAALIALDAAQGRTSDGIVEAVVTEDLRLAELVARCEADLDRFSTPLVTVTVDARDPKLKSGKPITFNLTSPAIVQTLTLMSVDISEIDVSPSGLLPRFHCTASKAVVSLESILRRLITKAG